MTEVEVQRPYRGKRPSIGDIKGVPRRIADEYFDIRRPEDTWGWRPYLVGFVLASEAVMVEGTTRKPWHQLGWTTDDRACLISVNIGDADRAPQEERSSPKPPQRTHYWFTKGRPGMRESRVSDLPLRRFKELQKWGAIGDRLAQIELALTVCYQRAGVPHPKERE
jgi:hypothetical protein